jgi:hypothetical protein
MKINKLKKNQILTSPDEMVVLGTTQKFICKDTPSLERCQATVVPSHYRVMLALL